MKVFVDTNVPLDVLAKREPLCSNSARVWSLAERGKIEALVSVISFNNVYYIVRKAATRKTADRALRLLRDVFTPVPLDIQILNQAIDSDFADFENAIQFHSAIRSDASCLVTRDISHFPTADLSILAPAEFLASAALE